MSPVSRAIPTGFDLADMPEAVEPLQSARQPQSLEAIYLLTPTSQNVNRIIADFDGRRTYRSAHLYFIDGENSPGLCLQRS
jgi:syntaxin-binding protein 1